MVDSPPSGGRGKGHHLPRGGVWGAHGIRGRPSATVSETRGISLRNCERAHRDVTEFTPQDTFLEFHVEP